MSIDLKSIAWYDDDYRELSDCNVNISTHALQYGTIVFGGMRGYYNQDQDNVFLFRLPDHARRLLQSAHIMQMQPDLDAAKIGEIALEIARRNQYKCNVYFRPFFYKSALQLSPRLHDVEDSFALYSLKLDDYLDTTRGMRTAVSSWRRIDENIIPTRSKAGGGYINSALAKSEAIQNGFDEAIFLDSRGNVCEGSAENIFLVRDNVIITPPIGGSILEGITRRSIIELARAMNYEVLEREIARSELYICDEAFFCGTGAQVAWIAEVDRRQIGNGQIGSFSERLRDRFVKIVVGEDDEFRHWLTPVY